MPYAIMMLLKGFSRVVTEIPRYGRRERRRKKGKNGTDGIGIQEISGSKSDSNLCFIARKKHLRLLD